MKLWPTQLWPDNWIRRRLFDWSRTLPARAIRGPDGEPYLERYMVCRLPWPFGGGRVYLHRFVASDPDRGLHDHPWRWAVSLILAGGYLEQRLARFAPSGRRDRLAERRAPAINLLGGRSFHRVILGPEAECWSIFIRPGRCKPWGFLTPRPAGAGADLPRTGAPIAAVVAGADYQIVEDAAESDPATWQRADVMRAAGHLRGAP